MGKEGPINKYEWSVDELNPHTQERIRHYSKGATIRLLVDVIDEDIDTEIASIVSSGRTKGKVIDSDGSLLRIGCYLAIRRILVKAAADAEINPIELEERT